MSKTTKTQLKTIKSTICNKLFSETNEGIWDWTGNSLNVWHLQVGENLFWIGIIKVLGIAVLLVTKQLTIKASIFMTAGLIIATILLKELEVVSKFLWDLAVTSVLIMVSKRR